MIQVPVYVETQKDLCVAHVLDLPGCFVRASSLEEALEALPGEIEKQSAWLRSAGQEAEIEEPVDLKVAEVVDGTGPFDPGDPAAILLIDAKRSSPGVA